MKNPNPQESQNNFDGDPRDSSDMTLVNFLKQNKPIAPPPAPNFEQQLFAEISKYPQRKVNKNLKRWQPWLLAIPVAIAAGFAFNWTNRSQMQLANNSNQTQIHNSISESDRVAIEQSLISSWTVTDESVYQSSTNTSNSESQILIELTPIEYE